MFSENTLLIPKSKNFMVGDSPGWIHECVIADSTLPARENADFFINIVKNYRPGCYVNVSVATRDGQRSVLVTKDLYMMEGSLHIVFYLDFTNQRHLDIAHFLEDDEWKVKYFRHTGSPCVIVIMPKQPIQFQQFHQFHPFHTK